MYCFPWFNNFRHHLLTSRRGKDFSYLPFLFPTFQYSSVIVTFLINVSIDVVITTQCCLLLSQTLFYDIFLHLSTTVIFWVDNGTLSFSLASFSIIHCYFFPQKPPQLKVLSYMFTCQLINHFIFIQNLPSVILP